MKRIKGLLKLALIIIIPVMLIMTTGNVSFATRDTSSYYVMLYSKTNEKRPTGYYWVTTTGTYKPVIKLVKTDSNGQTNNASDVIYCLDNEKGFGVQGETTTGPVLDYRKYYNMRNPSEIDSADKVSVPFSSSNYNSLMWLLDNMAIDEESKSSLSDAFSNWANNVNGYTLDNLKDYTMPVTDKNLQAQDILESVQQAVIWRLVKADGAFRPLSNADFAWTSGRNDGTNNHILDANYYDDFNGPARILYNYLVSTAQSNSSYDYTKNGSSPISYVKGFGETSQLTAQIKDNNYLVGPYNITNTGNSNLLNIAVEDLPSGAKLVDVNGNELAGATNADKIKGSFGTDFYILTPVTNEPVTLTITIKPTFSVRDITYRITEANNTTNQPIVVISNKNEQEIKSSSVVLTPPTFDLSLRKFITEVKDSNQNNKSIDNLTGRTPTVDTSTLLPTGTEKTTATYKHRKDPVTVEHDDYVQYTIRIYNEGQIAGRATQVIDQLPEGLAFDSIISGNFEKESYDTASNKLVLKRMETNTSNLPGYTSGTPSSEDIVIRCKVTATAGQSKQILTNVAWISAQVSEVGTVLTDRDSSPENVPNVNKNNMSDYKGRDNKDVEPGDSTYYYKGQEDDDDFEKLNIEPVPNTEFDLALRKFISKIVSEDGTERNAIRNVQVNETPLSTVKTAEYKHAKNPIEVQTGDTVYYSLRIYNEGGIEGRATEITDVLPAGVELDESKEIVGNFEKQSYSTSNNTLVLKRITGNTTNLPAYTTGSLQENGAGHETIVIPCKVTATSDTENDKVLTNIAWISEEYNAETEETIKTEENKDRDSVPNTHPTYSTDWKGTTTESFENLNKQIYFPGQEDDDDFEKIVIKTESPRNFDLALRKFITEIKDVNGKTRKVDRTPTISALNISDLANEDVDGTHDSGKTAIKRHSKDALTVSKGDRIKYTIRIYNEGNVNGTASKITDYLPEGLKLVDNSEINSKYEWNVDSSDTTGRTVTTTYLSAKNNIDAFNGTELKFEDVEIECEVVGSDITSKHLKNVAEITEFRNDANITTDRDSTVNYPTPKGDSYNVPTSEEGKGYEDDDDYEDLLLIRFDLALRKFITGVEGENRTPTVDKSKFGTVGPDGKEITSCTYNHTKDPVKVEQNQVVIYTIRVYNEGTVDGYAEVIKDDIPEGLEFIPEHSVNSQYQWIMLDESGNPTLDVSKAKFITTDYRSRAKSQTENLIKAFNKDTMTSPDFKDVNVAFKVIEPNTSDRIIINKAQISKHSDKDGNTDIPDIDSIPDVWNEGEDDQDIEKIYVKYFDLALRKWVTHAIVIEDGVQKEMETGHKAEDDPESVVKVELNRKRLEETVVKFRYSIRITNEGEIAGYATEISDYIPNGLRFNQADNPKWTESNGKIITDQLKDTLLQPGESATIDVILTWENNESNMGIMTNVAEISKDYNESGTPDIDSIPDNKKEGEDDIDDAPVALTVVAGSAPTYIAIASGITLIIGAGVFFIKKYVI